MWPTAVCWLSTNRLTGYTVCDSKPNSETSLHWLSTLHIILFLRIMVHVWITFSLSLSLPSSPSLFPPSLLSSLPFPLPLSPSSIPPNFASGEILNNQKAMEYNTQTGNLTCAFNFMQLRRIKRNSDKKASEVSPTYLILKWLILQVHVYTIILYNFCTPLCYYRTIEFVDPLPFPRTTSILEKCVFKPKLQKCTSLRLLEK